MTRAGAAERDRLNETFATLCRIESESRDERACADWIAGQLRMMGLDVGEDASGAVCGSNAGNLTARIPGPGPDGGPWVLFCAHMDTVPLAAAVEPALVDGRWENANPGILGADNKSAVAIFLELARHYAPGEPGGGHPPVGLEFVFTICEEISLLGSAAYDTGSLRSTIGFVFDQATPIGGVIIGSPTLYRIDAALHGRAAHAGVRPEQGRSAIAAASKAIAGMQLGRLDEQTTANVGMIEGGTAINVVPEHCTIVAEVRSHDAERAAAVATEIVDRLQDAADAGECDLDVNLQKMFEGYRLANQATQLAVAERALSACGHSPERMLSGGAADVNSFMSHGLQTICLADGVQANHTSGECVSEQALQDMLDVALTIVDESAVALVTPPAPAGA